MDRSAAYIRALPGEASSWLPSCVPTRLQVQLAYAIGVVKPVSVRVQAKGWDRDVAPDAVLEAAVERVFDLTPYGIIRELDLLRPIYRATASGGHFGRAEFPWERTDRAERLRQEVEAATRS